jgi:hypothetical protein
MRKHLHKGNFFFFFLQRWRRNCIKHRLGKHSATEPLSPTHKEDFQQLFLGVMQQGCRVKGLNASGSYPLETELRVRRVTTTSRKAEQTACPSTWVVWVRPHSWGDGGCGREGRGSPTILMAIPQGHLPCMCPRHLKGNVYGWVPGPHACNLRYKGG